MDQPTKDALIKLSEMNSQIISYLSCLLEDYASFVSETQGVNKESVINRVVDCTQSRDKPTENHLKIVD